LLNVVLSDAKRSVTIKTQAHNTHSGFDDMYVIFLFDIMTSIIEAQILYKIDFFCAQKRINIFILTIFTLLWMTTDVIASTAIEHSFSFVSSLEDSIPCIERD
jgi:hypothetical protein